MGGGGRTYQRRVGDSGEEVAVTYLQQRGYHILERNYQASTGEIDIICSAPHSGRDNHTELVFVEVKSRSAKATTDPIESLTQEKMNRVKRAAEVFMLARYGEEVACRFDMINIAFSSHGPDIEHVRDVMDY